MTPPINLRCRGNVCTKLLSNDKMIHRQTHRLSFDKIRTAQKMTSPTIHLLLRVFVATVTCLPSRCLAPNGGIHLTDPLSSTDRRDAHADTQTDGRDLWCTLLIWARLLLYIYKVPSFIRTGSGIQKLIGQIHRHTNRMEVAKAHFRKID
jgi:hypothetical protein